MDDSTTTGRAMLHPLLARRWSPTTFDPGVEATPAEVETLLEAARWAPSAGNSQPWAFVVGRRGDDTHTRLVRHLAASAARWAPSAAVLVANLSHRYVEDTDWQFSEFSLYDLGQAVAHMTVQAQSLGLHARQFRAFDRDALATEFAVPGHWEVSTMTAFGHLLPDVRAYAADSPTDTRPGRTRKSRSQLAWSFGADGHDRSGS